MIFSMTFLILSSITKSCTVYIYIYPILYSSFKLCITQHLNYSMFKLSVQDCLVIHLLQKILLKVAIVQAFNKEIAIKL